VKQNHVGQAVRALLLLSVAGFVVLRGRDYLSDSSGVPLSPTQYYVVACAVLALVLVLSTRRLIGELRDEKNMEWSARGRPVRSDITLTQRPAIESVHTYPIALRVIVGGCIVVWVSQAFRSGHAGRPTPPIDYVISFGLALVTAIYEFYICVFSLTIKSDRFVVTGFGTKEVFFSDISSVTIMGARGGPVVLLYAQDRIVARFSGRLTDFAAIKDVLLARWPVQGAY